MKAFKELFAEAREPKDVWKTGGQQVFTYTHPGGEMYSVLYTVKGKVVTFKLDVMGTKKTTQIGFKKDPEQAISDFLDEEL